MQQSARRCRSDLVVPTLGLPGSANCRRSTVNLGSGRFVSTFVLIIFAALFLLALAFIVANATFFLAGFLLTVPILASVPLPIIKSILAWIVSHQ